MTECPHCEDHDLRLEQCFQEIGGEEIRINATCDNCGSETQITFSINYKEVSQERNFHEELDEEEDNDND